MDVDESPEGPGDPHGATADDNPPAAHPRRTRVAIIALYTVALLGIGIVLGWLAVSRADPAETAAPPAPDVVTSDASVLMPDVRGLPEQTARTALVDADIPADRLVVEYRPAAGASGVVVTQDPAYGAADPQRVTLTISAPAAIPDLSGQTEQGATAELASLGARVEVQRRYQPGATTGTVIASSPTPGEPIGDSVVLTIAEPPGSAFLNQLGTIDGSPSCRKAEAVVAGRQYPNSVTCAAGRDGEDYIWLLAGKVDQFQGLIGVADDGAQDAAADVTVLVDGRQVATGRVSYTSPLAVDVPVQGGTQLQVRLTNPSGGSGRSVSIPVVLGDARVLGSRTLIDELAGWSNQ